MGFHTYFINAACVVGVCVHTRVKLSHSVLFKIKLLYVLYTVVVKSLSHI